MNKTSLFMFVLLLQLLASATTYQNNFAPRWKNDKVYFEILDSQDGVHVSHQPIFVKLQALRESSIVFWESIPQDFQDHVATINVNLLAVFVSSNAKSLDLHTDEVGNLWLSANYSFSKGDYISTLTWVSSETINENLTIPTYVPFPESYPDNVKPFLDPGSKIPVNDTAIQEIAKSIVGQDMVETVENVVSFLNETQNYDRQKVKLFMTGMLNTTNILDFLNDPLESLETGDSFCFERALLATTILRNLGVPARTLTNADLKTWIQVWLPGIGWVDAEVLCAQPIPFFPRPLSFVVPWMIENSSDAMFPFTWHPEVLMRVANLTLNHPEVFQINDYETIFSQPVDLEVFEANPSRFQFPIIFEPQLMQAALTWEGSNLVFHLSMTEKNASKTLVLEEHNEIEFEGFRVSFRPTRQDDIVFLNNFSVQKLLKFDIRILIPILIAVPVLLTLWLRRKRKPKP